MSMSMPNAPKPSEQLDEALEKQNKALELVAHLRIANAQHIRELYAALAADDRERFERALEALDSALLELDDAQRDLLHTGMLMMQSAVSIETDAMKSLMATWSDGYAAGYETRRALAEDAERRAYMADIEDADQWLEE